MSLSMLQFLGASINQFNRKRGWRSPNRIKDLTLAEVAEILFDAEHLRLDDEAKRLDREIEAKHG